MVNNNRGLLNLATHASIEPRVDPNELGRSFEWDLNNPQHQHILERLGNRVSPETPLRFICDKELTASDVERNQSRFVIRRALAEQHIFHCLTLQQRIRVNEGNVVQVVGHDPEGREWNLQLTSQRQKKSNSPTYVLIGQWAQMVRQNGWRNGDQLNIWGFPYASVRGHYEEVRFMFTV